MACHVGRCRVPGNDPRKRRRYLQRRQTRQDEVRAQSAGRAAPVARHVRLGSRRRRISVVGDGCDPCLRYRACLCRVKSPSLAVKIRERRRHQIPASVRHPGKKLYAIFWISRTSEQSTRLVNKYAEARPSAASWARAGRLTGSVAAWANDSCATPGTSTVAPTNIPTCTPRTAVASETEKTSPCGCPSPALACRTPTTSASSTWTHEPPQVARSSHT